MPYISQMHISAVKTRDLGVALSSAGAVVDGSGWRQALDSSKSTVQCSATRAHETQTAPERAVVNSYPA